MWAKKRGVRGERGRSAQPFSLSTTLSATPHLVLLARTQVERPLVSLDVEEDEALVSEKEGGA